MPVCSYCGRRDSSAEITPVRGSGTWDVSGPKPIQVGKWRCADKHSCRGRQRKLQAAQGAPENRTRMALEGRS